MTLNVTSQAFENQHPIPVRYTEDGDDVSPPLAWSNLPQGTKEFALIVDDPDAPTDQPWVHWLIYKIPADAKALPEGLSAAPKLETPTGALQGENSWGTIGYRGPAPPKGHGVHHYHFKLYALDTPLSVNSGLDKPGLLQAMKNHILGQGELVGTYNR
ncbi:MAG: YbhB/YbcL family Raf kinase inhibitor-like protein [Planctomycetes bacterium]|nr:YbhB/YbcL family Raf kinase inhibitor-like protein [Planctomycetota bacterium]